MLFQQFTDSQLEEIIDQFIFIYDGSSYLFADGIDKEYMVLKVRDSEIAKSLPKPVSTELFKLDKLDLLNVEWACMCNNIVFGTPEARDVQLAFMQQYIKYVKYFGAAPTPPDIGYEYIGPPIIDKPRVLEPRPIDSTWEPDPRITAHIGIKNDYNLEYVAYIFLKSEMKPPVKWGSSSSFKSMTGSDLGTATAGTATSVAGSHSWIQIMNITPEPIPVGAVMLPSLQQVTIGLWPKRGATARDWLNLMVPQGSSGGAGEMRPIPPDESTIPSGIRYNYESFERIMSMGAGDPEYSLSWPVTMGSVLTREQLNEINIKLLWSRWNSYNLAYQNCSLFAWSMIKGLPVFKHVTYPTLLPLQSELYAPTLVPPTPRGLGYSIHRAKGRIFPWDMDIDVVDDMPLNREFKCLTSGCEWLIPDLVLSPAWQLSDIWYKPKNQGGMLPFQRVQHTCVDPFAGRVK